MDRLWRIKFNWHHSISQDKDKTDCGDETWLYQLLLFCPRCERGHPFDFDSPYLPDSLIEPVYRDWRCRDCLLRRAGSDGIENVLRDASIGFVMMLLDCAAYLFTVCLICSSYWSWDEHFIQLYSPDSNSVYNHTTATRLAVTSQRHRERRWVKSSLPSIPSTTLALLWRMSQIDSTNIQNGSIPSRYRILFILYTTQPVLLASLFTPEPYHPMVNLPI